MCELHIQAQHQKKTSDLTERMERRKNQALCIVPSDRTRDNGNKGKYKRYSINTMKLYSAQRDYEVSLL